MLTTQKRERERYRCAAVRERAGAVQVEVHGPPRPRSQRKLAKSPTARMCRPNRETMRMAGITDRIAVISRTRRATCRVNGGPVDVRGGRRRGFTTPRDCGGTALRTASPLRTGRQSQSVPIYIDNLQSDWDCESPRFRHDQTTVLCINEFDRIIIIVSVADPDGEMADGDA